MSILDVLVFWSCASLRAAAGRWGVLWPEREMEYRIR
jgi:hypothetical protein